MNLRVAFSAFCLTTIVFLSGCLTDGGNEPEDPEMIAEQAMKAFGASAGSQDGGEISQISGRMEMTGSPNGEMGMFAGDTSFDMVMRWGKDDTMHLTFGVTSGGMTFNLQAWCSPTQTLFQWGNDIYASRPEAPGTPQAEHMCGETDPSFGDPTSGLDLFDSDNFEGLELQSLETHSDGSITAVFFHAEDDTTLTATIDPKGRLIRLASESPTESGAFDIAYGKRHAISIPEPNQRLPASIDWHTEVGGGAQLMTITSSPELPPLDEIEARLVLNDWANGTETVVVSFPTSASGPQTKLGYTFQYNDHDRDGRVSENDTWRFTHADWQGTWMIPEDPDLFDSWAGKSVNEHFTPGPGIALMLAVGALALAFVARRR